MKRFIYITIISLLGFSLMSMVLAQDGEPGDGSDTPPADTGTSEIPTREPRPAPFNRIRQDNIVFDVFFDLLPQGDIGVIKVEAADSELPGKGIISARARFIDQVIDFYPAPGDGFYGLIAASMEQTPRRYDLDVFVENEDGSSTSLRSNVEVTLGGFIRQQVEIPPERAFLLEPEVERNELARLEGLLSRYTPEKYWTEEGFQMPILSRLTSPFGAFRTFNATFNTRHTGWDIRSTLGLPIMASGQGVVAFTGHLDIRGNFVLVDHGMGVFSGYAHMSQMHVTSGQEVTKGQILGMTGDTGRTSGPHFHWEMGVNGEWVDTVSFMTTWMP